MTPSVLTPHKHCSAAACQPAVTLCSPSSHLLNSGVSSVTPLYSIPRLAFSFPFNLFSLHLLLSRHNLLKGSRTRATPPAAGTGSEPGFRGGPRLPSCRDQGPGNLTGRARVRHTQSEANMYRYTDEKRSGPRRPQIVSARA